MPPILWVFFVGVGLGTGLPLLQGVTKGVDPNVQFNVSPAPQEYRVWSAAASRRPNSGCAGTSFALSTRGRVTRLRVDGQEQLLDTSWKSDVQLSQGESRTSRYEFLDPVGGALLACREVTVQCKEVGRADRFVSSRSLCYDTMPVHPDEAGPARLKVIAPNFVSSYYRKVGGVWMGGGQVELVVKVVGEVTEEWWCPDVEVDWPDQTRSFAGGDCDPWADSASQRTTAQSWTFPRRLAPGENRILVRLVRNGHTLVSTTVLIRVTG